MRSLLSIAWDMVDFSSVICGKCVRIIAQIKTLCTMTGLCLRHEDHTIIFEYKFELLCLDLHASSHFKNTLEEKKKNQTIFFKVTSDTLMHQHTRTQVNACSALLLVGFCWHPERGGESLGNCAAHFDDLLFMQNRKKTICNYLEEGTAECGWWTVWIQSCS